MVSGTYLLADINLEYKKELEETGISLQRQIEGFYDMQYNTVSAIEFTVHNTGMTFFDAKLRRLTGI
jgi:hypothetical protein